jgi:signal transduction histidine kinase
MNLIKPAKNKSAYLLEGYDRNWIYPENNRASFTNLPAGNYRLLVKAANNDGIWNETPAVLQIEVLPPPWKTWWAYTLYALALGLLAFGIAYFFSSRTAMRRRLRYEHMMYVKQQELYQMKMDFFTHISHELRTPLTLIVGPLEVLTQMLTGNQQAQKMINTIRQNADRLVKLTNDLLAFRKAEAGHTQLAPEKADIVAFSKSIFEKFEGEATRRSMHYRFESATPLLEVNFDKHHMEIVLTNLLSNAFKFTDDNGNIDFTIKEPHHGMLDILVRDNGIGIPSESQDKIFSGFYQAGSRKGKHAGSGIGLAFSRRLVELHRGSLSFRSGINEATGKMETCFTVSIPVENTDA